MTLAGKEDVGTPETKDDHPLDGRPIAPTRLELVKHTYRESVKIFLPYYYRVSGHTAA